MMIINKEIMVGNEEFVIEDIEREMKSIVSKQVGKEKQYPQIGFLSYLELSDLRIKTS